MNGEGAPANTETAHGIFHSTHWSVVLAARSDDSAAASTALQTLCRTYWYPLYGFVRRRGFSVEDAQDLTQEFFYRLLQRDFLRNVARGKGRFRSFLLVALKNFLVTEWRSNRSAKRGGAHEMVSWDALEAEERYAHEPATGGEDESYDYGWAMAVMEQGMTQLRGEFVAANKGGQFERLQPWLSKEGSSADYAALAQQWEMSPGAVSVAIHRFRRRFAESLRSVVMHTVASPEEVEDEVQLLGRMLQRA